MTPTRQTTEYWDVITSTPSGGTVWRNYGYPRKIVTTVGQQTPNEALKREEAEVKRKGRR